VPLLSTALSGRDEQQLGAAEAPERGWVRYDAGMRSPVDEARLRAFLDALGARVKGRGTVFLTGGATALLYGWRESTVDIDLRLDPEPLGAFEAIATLKEELDVNVELASPADFLPELPGWRERSPSIGRFGAIDAFHYDLYAQALSKVERGHERDLDDARAMLERGLIQRSRLLELFEEIEPGLVRFPAVEPGALRRRLEGLVREE
jgi:hypothetical protein